MEQHQVSKYQRERLLFESNHLQVYEGYELKTQKKVFLKLVDERAFGIFDKSSDQKAKDMIFKTGIELRRLQNNIFGSLSRCNDERLFTPRVHEISQEGAQTCIVTPGSEFGFLSSYLQAGQYLKEADALLLLKQITLGLIEFHQLNMPHGAVCADNVVVREKGVELNLLCFQAGEFSKSTPEMMEIDKECNSYLAPELLLDPSLPNTKESDMWSLGALLARLLRGKHVFYGSTRKSVFEQICQYEEMMVKCMADDCNQGKTDFPIFISDAVLGLIRKLMSKNPADRPSAQELILHPLLEGIRIEMRKQSDYPSALPEQMNSGEEKFAVIKESQKLNEIDRYIGEEICFGFSKLKSEEDDGEDSCSLVQFKTIGLEEGAMSEKYLQRLEQFSKIDLKGSCKTIGIRAVVYVPGSQSNQNNNNKSASIVIAQDYSNMGTLEEYLLAKKKANVKGLTVANSIRSMHRLLFALSQISNSELLVLGTLHSKSLYIDSGIFRIGEPLGLEEATTNSKFNEKMRAFDYFANEFKQNLIDNNPRADLRKVDIWSFGFLFYRFIFGEPPIFDLQEKPIFPIQTSIEVSDRIKNVISACLIPQIPPRAVWLSLIQSLHDEQQILGYDFDMSPAQISQDNNIQADEPGFELFKYRDKGDKLKMKNMLSPMGKMSLDIKQLESKNIEESGKYFQNARKGKGIGQDGRLLEMSESSFSNYDKGIDASIDMDQNRQQQQQQGYSNSFIDYGDNQEGDSSLPFKKYPENEDASLVLEEPKRFLDNLRQPRVGRQEIMVPTAGLLVHYNETEISYQLMRSESTGGENLRIIKIYTKAICVVLLFLTLFFRKNLLNSWEAMLNRGDMRSIQISNLSISSTSGANVITQDIEQFLATKSPNLDSLIKQYGCIDNQQFNPHSPSVVDAVRGGGFFVWAFMCFISAIAIIASRSFLIARIDTLTIQQNYISNGTISKHTRKFLIPGQIIAHLEFAFVYYSHYQFFNFFYYAVFNPCLGVDTTDDSTFLIFDSTRLVFSGKSGEFITKIMCTVGIFGFLHFSTLIVYSFFPLIFSKYFLHWIHVFLRGCSFLFGCWIMCRLGAFLIFQPTISFDDESLISASLSSGEYQAVFGFIPEIIEIILIGLDLLLEFVFLHIGLALDKRQKDTSTVNLNKNTVHSNIRFRRNVQNIKLGSKMQLNLQKKQPSIQQPQISVSQAALSVYSKQTKKP